MEYGLSIWDMDYRYVHLPYRYGHLRYQYGISSNDMGDDSIDMVISNIDMGYLVTLVADDLLMVTRCAPASLSRGRAAGKILRGGQRDVGQLVGRQHRGGGHGVRQGLTLVHFSAQPEPFLTQNTP
jgi:hypothetical protein